MCSCSRMGSKSTVVRGDRSGSCRLTDRAEGAQVPSPRILEPNGLTVFTEVGQGFQDLICLQTSAEPGALDNPVLCPGLSRAKGLLGQPWEGGNSTHQGPVRALSLPGDSVHCPLHACPPSSLSWRASPSGPIFPSPPVFGGSQDRSWRQPPVSTTRDTHDRSSEITEAVPARYPLFVTIAMWKRVALDCFPRDAFILFF